MRSRTVQFSRSSSARSKSFLSAAGATLSVGGAIVLLMAAQPAYAIGTAVDLGTAGSYSVLGGSTVTNTGPSTLNADLGVSPGSAVTGFPPGIALGAMHVADAPALQAQNDLVTAYNSAAGQAPDDNVAGDLGGLSLAPGVYNASSSIGLTGTLSLDAEGDPDAVFIFQIGSTLITAPDSTVALLNGAQSCNVFWQVGSSATLGSGTAFVGTIMALTSISADTGATVEGRALARNGAVTLDTNAFSGGACASTPPPSATPTATPTPSATAPAASTPATPPAGGGVAPPGGPGVTPPGGGGAQSVGNGPAVGGNGTADTSVLAATGTSANPYLLAAASAAMLAGMGLVVVGRRTSRRTGRTS